MADFLYAEVTGGVESLHPYTPSIRKTVLYALSITQTRFEFFLEQVYREKLKELNNILNPADAT